MDYNHKAEEKKLYFHYFRVWMILAAIAVIAFGIVKFMHKDDVEEVLPERNNNQAPAQRVYDYADVLSDSEEKTLAKLIAECEDMCRCDLILVTIDQEVGASDSEWNHGMVNIADDFFDQKAFGFDKPHGDGALLLDNWYHAGQSDSQAGAWLSTSGKLKYAIGASEEEEVFRAMDDGFERSTMEGYASAIREIAKIGVDSSKKDNFQLPWILVFIATTVVALIYAAANMKQAPGVDTTTATTYVPGGKPNLKVQRDEFLRKSVSKVKIETQSSGSGGGSYGHHTSSGGYSHGGGGHRR